MLADSNFNPKNIRKLRQIRTAQPVNRAAYLGNDATGMTQHYYDIDINTFAELKPVVKRSNTWCALKALAPLRKRCGISALMRQDNDT